MSGYTIASLLTLLNPDGDTPQELSATAVPDEQPLLTLDDSDMTWLEELLR
jgi:hypothetical protein